MSLQNLIGVSLEPIEIDAAAIRRLLAAAERNIADSHVEAISNESRFDAAYKAIMQLANAALQANGFRTLTSKPGHHRTLIRAQSAGDSIKVSLAKPCLPILKRNKSALVHNRVVEPLHALSALFRKGDELANT